MDQYPKCVFCIVEKAAARSTKEIPEHLRGEYWALGELVLTKGLMTRLATQEDLGTESMCPRHWEDLWNLRSQGGHNTDFFKRTSCIMSPHDI